MIRGFVDDVEGFEFILMRHAESVNNRLRRDALIPGIYQRIPDPPLTPHGREQATIAAANLCAFIVNNKAQVPPASVEIFTSDMVRTIETAMYVAKGLRYELPSTRVCVVPLPFFNEMGSETVVSEPLGCRFAGTARECGAFLDGSLWRSSWGESQAMAGDYEACLFRFLSVVMPWVKERCRRNSHGILPVLVGHGQYMRHMLNIWKRFQNAEAIRCRFRSGKIEFVDFIR